MPEKTVIDPALAPFIAAFEAALGEPAHMIEPARFRALAASLSPLKPETRPADVSVSDHVLAANDRAIGMRLYRPQGESPLPALLYFHGGGWMIGSVDTYDAITAEIASRSGCLVVSVDYALAPEHPYPAAIQDALAAWEWLAGNAEALEIDPARIAVGGDSAGGQIAASLCLWLRDSHGEQPFALQWLIYPALDTDFERRSQVAQARAPILPAATLRWFWAHYLQELVGDPPVYAVPLRTSDFHALPPAVISVAGFDPLHDEGCAFAAALTEAGVEVTLIEEPTLVHGHLRMRTVSPVAQAAFARACTALRLGLE